MPLPPPPQYSRRAGLRALLGVTAAAIVGETAASGCFSTGATALLPLHKGVMALDHDGRRLVWLTGPNDGALLQVPMSGKPVRTLVGGLDWPQRLLCRDGHAWVGCRDQLLRVSLTGSARQRWPAKNVTNISASTSGVYWTQSDGSLHRIHKHVSQQITDVGPAPTTLLLVDNTIYWASGQPAALQRSGPAGRPRTLTQHTAIYDLRAYHDNLLFLTNDTLQQWSLTDHRATTLASALRSPSALTLHRDHAYFINGPVSPAAPHQLLRVPLSGGPPKTIASIAAPQALTIAAGYAYVPDGVSRKLWRYPLGKQGAS